jgi:adenylate cyclase
MFDAIGSHGGVVNQMIGDGLMALFGAPLPLENCAASAVAASLEMLALLADFNHEREATSKKPIRVGVGIATGEVVAGYTGTQQRASRGTRKKPGAQFSSTTPRAVPLAAESRLIP